MLCAPLSAHRRDELLQAARIAVGPDRLLLEMSLTPGIAVSEHLIGEIDGNGDGVLDIAEQRRYVDRMLSRMALRVDGSAPLRLSLTDATFPPPPAMRTGTAAIEIQLEAAMPSLRPGAHRLAFRNDHATEESVYLANALVPESDRVAVTAQHRDVSQRQLIIEFALHNSQSSGLAWWWIGPVSVLAALAAQMYGRLQASRPAAIEQRGGA